MTAHAPGRLRILTLNVSPPARHLVLTADLNAIDRPFEDGRYQAGPAPDYEGS